MTGKLRVDADVVERACQYGDEDRARVGTGGRVRAEIAALTGCYCSDDEPNDDDEPSDSHMYLRKDGRLLLCRRAANAGPTLIYPAGDGYTCRAASK
jgi:hypothetical protein